ncbi:GNAT family N-acetyltransferase [Staphylococcus schweitzeri]|uniref:GNAT family N-acetyltransferase n=2 Tax=Staphylococcus schweitzeri TaxID=1654388 RepID=A0ABR9NCN4_9STAP|nr:GNAT family N-acetyltransferase [Staphylococcus schweitzeri]MBE2129802.1 GNAT family N-acetyltransferase [Staphylococcus schweitzeri]CDR51534.1 putative acetyltransferase [Staphylococcus schweitzeri]CDR55096.1 putative acetyltransferase [Staphylococcus schweitzeri]CDR60511.1 putative acetyltransferase [Staphylococcus schweitzeri]VEE65237.1 Acetyltransferase (GNAT) family [Staphylococcus schweitzeri]
MRALNKNERDYIHQIANIHELLLTETESGYRCTSLSVALRFEMICSRLEYSNDKIYIVENDSQLCAFIWGHFNSEKQIVSIELLYVEPQYRNRRLAARLKCGIESWAKSIKAKQVVSTVHKDNVTMISLNKRLGYQLSHVKMYKDIE